MWGRWRSDSLDEVTSGQSTKKILLSPGATQSACRIIDFLPCKLGLETFEADAVDTYYQAQECEGEMVEPAPECLERLAKAGRDSHCVAIATSAAGETCRRSELGGTLGRSSCEQVRFEQCRTTSQFYGSPVRLGPHSWGSFSESTQTIHQ